MSDKLDKLTWQQAEECSYFLASIQIHVVRDHLSQHHINSTIHVIYLDPILDEMAETIIYKGSSNNLRQEIHKYPAVAAAAANNSMQYSRCLTYLATNNHRQ